MKLTDLIERPEIVTSSDYLSQINQDVLFRPLLSTDEKNLTTFLEILSESTRHYCVYPSYDQTTAQLFCNKELNDTMTARLSPCISGKFSCYSIF
jgi:hypothetical protein